MNRPTESAWIRLFHETVPALHAYVARRAGGDRELTEDVTQEAWLRAIDHWRTAFPEEPLAWLKTVARNLVANHFRRQRPVELPPEALVLKEEEVRTRTTDAAALLQWGLARMRAQESHLIEAYHLDGQGIATIAADLGISERAVEGRLRRSRQALRRRLQPFWEGNPS